MMARVLVIDDNYDMLSMLKMILERQGKHEVTACTSGQEGLEIAFNEPPDIALVDVMMPGMSGYDVVRQLRADPRTERIGIIILTARGQIVDREAALAAGADDHMTKPANVDELLKRIDELLNRDKAKAQLTGAMTLPVLSVKGGVGVTTLAINLANVLQQIAPTVLLDLTPTAGQCAFFLGMRPEKHWGHYLENHTTPVISLLQTHSTGLRVLLAPPLSGQHGWPNADAVTAILTQLTTTARFVVVDMPPLLDPAAQTVLAYAHRILLVSGDDAPAIQVTRATLQALQEWKDHLLVIRNAATPGPHPPAEAVQKALRVPLAVNIAYDPAQVTVVAKGLPLAAVQPKTPLVLGVKRIVQLLLAR
ncbi:MAG: response regulator [Anaerolineae bacterium]|nr:response regulator [Anaerolineae bacterium]